MGRVFGRGGGRARGGRVLALLAAAALLGAALLPTSLARPVAVPTGTPFNVDLSASPAGAFWEDIGAPFFCTFPSGVDPFNIGDASLPGAGLGDAYDNALCLFVNGAPFLNPATVDLTGTTVTTGPQTLSGLSVVYQYFFLTSTPVVRALASFTNPTPAPITATIGFEINLGSDTGTVIEATSSGDTTFTTADRWVVTSDGSPLRIHRSSTCSTGPAAPR
jgi:hypothetical protein